MPAAQKIKLPRNRQAQRLVPKPPRVPQMQSEIAVGDATSRQQGAEPFDRSLAHCCPNTWWP